MKPALFIWSFLLISLCVIPQGYAQYKFEKAIHFNEANGLPSNEIRGIAKGEDGFMWLGTTEGLCRFDGIQFRVYKPEPGNPHSIFAKDVKTVLPDGKNVWVATNQGVSVLDVTTGKFRNYQFSATGKSDSVFRTIGMETTSLEKDNEGEIWIGTRERGVCRYDAEKDDFVFYEYQQPDTAGISRLPGGYNTILSIESNRFNDSIIWAGTLSGLLEINKYTGTVINHFFPKPDKDYQTSVNVFRRLYHHTDGLLYTGTWNIGAHIFNPSDNTLTPVKLPDGDDSNKNIAYGSVSSLYPKNDHIIWVTASIGLLEYNTQLHKLTWVKKNINEEKLFYGVECVDDANRAWYSDITGVQLFDPLLQQFRNESFEHLFIKGKWGFCFYIEYDSAENLIIVCPRLANGLYIFNRNKQQWTKWPFRGMSKLTTNEILVVRGFTRRDKNRFYISCDEGLFEYNSATKTIGTFAFRPELVFKRYGNVLWDDKERLWFCADTEGLFLWDSKTGKTRVFKKELGLEEPLTTTFALSRLYRDSRDNIWLTRSNGFSVYDPEKDTIYNNLYKQNPETSFPVVHDIAEDKHGRLWLSAGNGGMGYALAANPEKGIVKKISPREQGKPIDEVFFKLATDKNGNVWGINDKLLLKINADNLSSETFSMHYSLDPAEFFGFTILPDDELVLGGRNSITLANPHDLQRNPEAPRPFLTSIHIRQQPLDDGIPVFGKEQLRLKHWQNFFSFGFSAQAFSFGKETRFRYRLQGFDEWVETPDGRLANYTNVPGGNYVFQLQAANNEGVWSDEILEVPVFVGTAWWKTWWFRVPAIIALVVASLWLYRWRIKQVKQKEYLRAEFEKKLANVEMGALRAQMNPHFLFNSLNSIDSYIIRNETKKASEYLNNFARLIRLILQNSRSNYISLKDELETLELYLQMESLRFKNKFQYEIHIQEDLDTSSIDIPPMLIQPYVENAIWHGLMHQDDQSGKVKVSILEQNGKLLCIVEDNGIGREKAMEIRSKKSGITRKSMGMTITKDRIEIINKLYDTQTSVHVTDLRDEAGKPAGTKVELKIPV